MALEGPLHHTNDNRMPPTSYQRQHYAPYIIQMATEGPLHHTNGTIAPTSYK